MNPFLSLRWAAVLAASLFLQLPPRLSAAMPAGTDMANFIRLYETDRSSVGRFYELPWSPVRFERMERLIQEWQARLERVDFDSLDPQGRIDFFLLRTKLVAEGKRFALERRRLAEMEELLPFREVIQNLERARWSMGPVDPQKSATALADVPSQIKKLRQRVEKVKKEEPKKDAPEKSPGEAALEENKKDEGEAKEAKLKVNASLARRTAAAVSELRGTLRTWSAFYDGFVPDFTWWVKKPNEETQTALEDYAKFLREEIAGLKGKDEDPLIGDPIGAEALADDIAAEMLPYTAQELIAIGEQEFAWCEARLKEATKEMGFGEDWKAALAKVKLGHVPPGQQDRLVLEQAREAIQFVQQRQLVTVPPLCEELWRLTMIAPEAQKTMPYAAYSGPNMLVAYARDDMKHDDKLMSMRGNNRHFMRIVTPHELIPGHHLQGFMAARHQAHRGLFYTPFYVEGWSLYWEIMFWDLNYAQTPEDRIGMLFWRMHRCARIIVSLKFHLGQMTPAEMVDFIVQRVGHERFGATSEVRRFISGGYSPLYQSGYMIGGLQLRALRRDLVESGRMTDLQFNDAVLQQGPIPIELVRVALAKLPLARDSKLNWKFAGPNPGKP